MPRPLPTTYKAQLSSYDAANCVSAKKPVCKCRCGGQLHGTQHDEFMQLMRLELDENEEFSRDWAVDLATKLAKKYERQRKANSAKQEGK